MSSSLSLSAKADLGEYSRETPEAGSMDPFSIFLLAIRSSVTKEKYLQRMGYFFDFLNISKANDFGQIIPMERRFDIFSRIAAEDIVQLTNNIVRYLQRHKQRVERKEITGSTLRNYIKLIKLFCEQMDIEIPWKKITRGMPKGRRYANDRAPTIEEIRKICEYPDRRIKPIIYTMSSSGMRLGALQQRSKFMQRRKRMSTFLSPQKKRMPLWRSG